MPYAAWNQAIASHFFNASKHEQPVYLQADAEAIRLIGQQLGLPPDEAETSFQQAVQQHVFVTFPHANNIIVSAKYMPRDGQPPDFIGFLALCVLAASRMERDDDLGVSAANYYRCLNDLLRLERDGRPPWFADTVIAWVKLAEWLHEVHEGRYGIATARPLNPTHPYVGYPQSQCLLRAADRQHLPAFFRWARLETGDMPPREWLLAMLHAWAGLPRCPLSASGRRRILEGSSAVTDALGTIMALELEAWDGSAPGEHNAAGRAERPLLRLAVHSAAQQVSWYQYAGEALTPLCGVPDMFARTPADPGKAVAVFGDHPDIGQWTLVPRVTLGAMHVLLVHELQGPGVRAFLARAARPTWQEQALHGLPPGWLCMRGVELVRADPKAPWDSLRLQDTVAVGLQGGLALDRNVYLADFEPTLIIDGPDLVSPLLLDQQRLPDHLGGRTVIPLAPYCGQPGYHTITVGSRTHSFITRNPHCPSLAAQAVPQIAYPLRRMGGGYVPCTNGPAVVTIPPMVEGTIYVSGAAIYGRAEDLPGLLPHTVVTQGGFKGYLVIGRQPGELFEHRSGFVVRKDQQADRQASIAFEVPFEPQWLVKIGRHKCYLSPLQPYVPPPTALPIGEPAQVEAWVRTVSRKSYVQRFGEEHRATWQRYAAAGARLKAVR